MVKIKKLKRAIYLGLLTINFLPFALVKAQSKSSITNQMIEGIKGSNLEGLPKTGIEPVIGNVIQAFLSVFGVVFLSLIVYGGYIWLKAQGRDEEVKKAKDTIRSAIIGLAITLAAYTISYFVVQNLVGATQVK